MSSPAYLRARPVPLGYVSLLPEGLGNELPTRPHRAPLHMSIESEAATEYSQEWELSAATMAQSLAATSATHELPSPTIAPAIYPKAHPILNERLFGSPTALQQSRTHVLGPVDTSRSGPGYNDAVQPARAAVLRHSSLRVASQPPLRMVHAPEYRDWFRQDPISPPPVEDDRYVQTRYLPQPLVRPCYHW